jgi:hypothetical protein
VRPGRRPQYEAGYDAGDWEGTVQVGWTLYERGREVTGGWHRFRVGKGVTHD